MTDQPTQAELAQTAAYANAVLLDGRPRLGDSRWLLARCYRALSAENERLAKAKAGWDNAARGRDALSEELEAEKVKLSKSQAAYDQLQRRLTDVLAEMRTEAAARQARVMPSREAIADAICGATLPSREKPGEGSFAPMLRAADAVLRLLAPTQASRLTPEGEDGPRRAEPTGARPDPPDPLPERIFQHRPGMSPLRADGCLDNNPGSEYCSAQQARYVPSVGERPFCREAPPGSEIGMLHELETNPVWETASSKPSPLRYDGKRIWSGEYQGQPWTRIFGDSVIGWRRAQPQGEVTTDVEANATNGGAPEQRGHTFKMRVTGGARGHVSGTLPGKPPESDAAWLKRTVEELTTARPVEVTLAGGGALRVSSPNQGDHHFLDFVKHRDVSGIQSALSRMGWPLRRNARPVEPAANPIEALSKRVERAETDLDELNGLYGADLLDVRKRLDELELQGRVTRRMATCDYPQEWWKSCGGDCVTTADMIARIEREERAK